jgi:endoglucanase
MNEPHDMGSSDWKLISQAAVDAIRQTGDRKRILVPGNSYSNSDRFAEINGPLAWITDPANQVAYEAHCYFDSDYSGTYAKSYDQEQADDSDLEYRGVRRVLQFVGWCAANGVPGFLGELGVPGDDPRWLRVLGHALRALDHAGVDCCWWAAGEWWGNYRLSLQPRDEFRKSAPQLEAFLKRG